MDNPMVRVSHISKQYRLGQIGGTTLREEIQRFSAKLRHREDPTRPIGARRIEHKNEVFLALKDVSFDINPGERLGIIGHNGAGKSTLLKLISRVTAPSSGWIGLNGRVASMLEVGTGFHGELTGRENIFMNGAILGMTKREIDRKIDDIIDFSECRQFIDTPVKRYSSGMYVKLAFAVAAHLDSEIMIMDEVLAVGDMAFQKKCLDKMNEVSQAEGRTILYVSHNMNTIQQLCNRCIVLDHGNVAYDGSILEGIDIYLRSSYGEAKTFYDFSCKNKSRWSRLGQIADLLSLELCEKKHPRYEFQEPVLLRIDVEAHHAVDHLSFRIELLSEDGVYIGSAFAEDTGNLEENQSSSFFLCLNTHNIIPGNYLATVVLYQHTEHHASNDLDYVERAFSFEISDTKNKMPIVWNKDKWGHVILENMVLVDKIALENKKLQER